ncbi:MAG: dihydrolipoamide acetyltransferase, partial [Rhodobacteraceae bacterium]|nr:dihydrolipoamide acetyltransferase [Paracoccaceae bacterium]
MAEVIAAPSVRALAQRKGIDIEQRAQALGRTTIAREDLEDAGAGAGAGAAEGAAPGTAPWQVDHAAWGPV